MAYFTPWDAALCTSALFYCTNCSLFLLEWFVFLIFLLQTIEFWIVLHKWLNFDWCASHSVLLIGWECSHQLTSLHSFHTHSQKRVKQFQDWSTSTKMCIFFFFNEYALNNKSAIQISEFWMQWAWDDTLRESSLKIHLHDTQRASHILLLPQVQTNW